MSSHQHNHTHKKCTCNMGKSHPMDHENNCPVYRVYCHNYAKQDLNLKRIHPGGDPELFNLRPVMRYGKVKGYYPEFQNDSKAPGFTYYSRQYESDRRSA